jgi:metallo-beta-lactamase family protein
VLVDCGLYQGLKPLRLRNWSPFPVDPASIDAVVLTHAHVDHSGYLPALVRNGFRGPIFATSGTQALAAIVLPDCAHLQEEDASYSNRRGYSKHTPALPLYTSGDAERALGQFRVAELGAAAPVAPGIVATFRPAGHILGSAMVALAVDGRRPRTVLVSGDLGRPHHPILTPPADPPAADVVLIESTYGDRRHEDVASLQRFEEAIVRTAARDGTIVIPAFAVDRTEVLLLHLRRLMHAARIPSLPVYVDSPMALAALAVYRRAIASGGPEIRPDFAAAGDGDPFDPGRLIEARTVRDSMAINEATGAKIIISASGMASGGRVLHHLAHHLPDERSAGSRSAFARERGRSPPTAPVSEAAGRYVGVRAEVVSVPAFRCSRRRRAPRVAAPRAAAAGDHLRHPRRTPGRHCAARRDRARARLDRRGATLPRARPHRLSIQERPCRASAHSASTPCASTSCSCTRPPCGRGSSASIRSIACA